MNDIITILGQTNNYIYKSNEALLQRQIKFFLRNIILTESLFRVECQNVQFVVKLYLRKGFGMCFYFLVLNDSK